MAFLIWVPALICHKTRSDAKSCCGMEKQGGAGAGLETFGRCVGDAQNLPKVTWCEGQSEYISAFAVLAQIQSFKLLILINTKAHGAVEHLENDPCHPEREDDCRSNAEELIDEE